jgi:hypothetical protein
MDFLRSCFLDCVAAASELSRCRRLKDNSIIQLVFHALRAVKGKKL